MCCAISIDWRGGVKMSSAPTSTSVGVVTVASSARRSNDRMAAAKFERPKVRLSLLVTDQDENVKCTDPWVAAPCSGYQDSGRPASPQAAS